MASHTHYVGMAHTHYVGMAHPVITPAFSLIIILGIIVALAAAMLVLRRVYG